MVTQTPTPTPINTRSHRLTRDAPQQWVLHNIKLNKASLGQARSFRYFQTQILPDLHHHPFLVFIRIPSHAAIAPVPHLVKVQALNKVTDAAHLLLKTKLPNLEKQLNLLGKSRANHRSSHIHIHILIHRSSLSPWQVRQPTPLRSEATALAPAAL